MIDENSEDTTGLDVSSKRLWNGPIADYNAMFGTHMTLHRISSRIIIKDIESSGVKDEEIDVLIVV